MNSWEVTLPGSFHLPEDRKLFGGELEAAEMAHREGVTGVEECAPYNLTPTLHGLVTKREPPLAA